MPLDYVAGFDTVRIAGGFAVVVAGPAAGTVTLPAGNYGHIQLTGLGVTDFSKLDTVLESTFQDLSAGFELYFDLPTLTYTITHPTPFSLTWTGDAGTNLRRALGFSGDVALTTIATSDVVPYYVIRAKTEGRSQFTDVYEPADIVEESIADGGSSAAVAKRTQELLCDWGQPCEIKASTLARAAASSAPWTFEHLFKHCRGALPFAVVGDSPSGNLYKLRAQGAGFTDTTRRRRTSDYDGLWDLQFYTRDLGELP